MGSTGNLPVPTGNLPTGTSEAYIDQSGAGWQSDAFFHSAGLVAQRDGQVARATQGRESAGMPFIFLGYSTENSEEPKT